jgi:uncharacterized protein
MFYKKINDNYIIRLERGEELMESLARLAECERIKSGYFSGLGAALQAELGIYLLDKKVYQFRNLDGPLEILSIIGGISSKDGQVFVHAHMSVADSELNVRGGHVKSATIGATCEIFLIALPGELTRSHHEDIGLHLLDMD